MKHPPLAKSEIHVVVQQPYTPYRSTYRVYIDAKKVKAYFGKLAAVGFTRRNGRGEQEWYPPHRIVGAGEHTHN
jgi:hypothetical protein